MNEHDQAMSAEELDPHAGRVAGEEDELDLTPMVDVTFLLLIFFMVTAAFALQKSIEVPPVDEESAAAQTVQDLEQDSIVIRVDGDNVFWVGAPKWEAEQRPPVSRRCRSNSGKRATGDLPSCWCRPMATRGMGGSCHPWMPVPGWGWRVSA